METLESIQGKLAKSKRTIEYAKNCKTNFLNRVATIQKNYDNAIERETDYEGTIARNYLDLLNDAISEYENQQI